MPEEENKKLRDLVSETLQTKGVLGRIQAEIRASVFLALEEQDVFKDKSPFINKQLKDFLKSSDGVTVISLVREFLEFFNLEFASMVFDPETHAGLDYNYEGRSKLANMLNINDNDKHLPLLGHVLKLSKTYLNNQTEKDDCLTNDNTLLNKKPVDINIASNVVPSVTTDDKDEENHHEQEKYSQNSTDNSKLLLNSNHTPEQRLQDRNSKQSTSVGASLTSLSNFPPIRKNNQTELKHKKDTYDLKSLLDLSLEKEYDDDFLSSDSDLVKKGLEAGSEESEIEEEISAISNVSVQPEDNTSDISISKASGHADYLETL